jgi:prolyl oligopeptidase family protein
MRFNRLALVAVVSLAAPLFAHGDIVPGAVPDLTLLTAQVPRGSLATSFASSVPPGAKTVDGNIGDWEGEISRWGGTAIYSHGEYVYQDYLRDAWGADDGQDAARTDLTDQLNSIEGRTYRAEALSQALGEQFDVNGELDGDYCPETVCSVANYGDVEDSAIRGEADIEEVRIAADATNLSFLVRTTGMKDGRTGVLLLLGETVADHLVQGGVRTTARHAILASGNAALSVVGDGSSPAPGDIDVATNATGSINAVEISVPRASVGAAGDTFAIGVATGVIDGAALKSVKLGDAKSDLVNVAFRFDEPARIWMEHDQALALRAGDIDRYIKPVRLDRLSSGYTESFEPQPGYHERVYISDSPVNIDDADSNASLQGPFQHYGVYLPSTYRQAPGTQFPTTWWTHYRGGHAHDAAAWIPGLLRQFGEAKGNIMIMPSARGTSSWYVGRGHEDFLNVWDDSMATLPIDPDRVYMTGYSMGGFASWFLPMVYPDRFAGASPQEGPPTQGLFAGIGPNAQDPTGSQNGGDAQAELTFNIIENARNVPFVIYHGTDDELVPVTGILRMQARFIELGYRNRLYLLDGNEHYTTAVLDSWTEAARYLNRFRRDPNPPHVTYRRWPALEHAASTVSTPTGVDLAYKFDRAYWVSDLVVRTVGTVDGKPDPASWGTIDATTFGRGVGDNLLIPEAGAGLQGTPYEMTGLAWLGNGRTAPRNAFDATLTNLSNARIDLARMGLATSGQIAATVNADGPTTLQLAGVWASTPLVEVCDPPSTCTTPAVSYVGGVLSISFGAGVHTVRIA